LLEKALMKARIFNSLLATGAAGDDASVANVYGALTKIDYSDSTPDVNYAHDRLGQLSSVVDALGTRSFSYDYTNGKLQLMQESYPSSFPGTSGAVIHRLYENGTGGTVVNRYKGFEVKFGGTTQFTNTYGYDNAGRLQTVSDSGGVIGTYAYTVNSASMVATLTRQTGSAGALVSTNTWFQFHDRLDVVANTLAGASTSAYDYAVNALGQRTSVATSGSAFSGITGASWSSWGYNNQGEVTSATHSSDATRNRNFIYDSIGNRKNSRNGSTTAVGYLVTDLVTPSLPSTNKYTKYFSDTDNDGVQDPGETTTLGTPVHDDDGNMTDDGGSGTTGRTFVWDAENRLIQVKDKSTTPKLLATYTYDYRGRRVKKVTTADAVQGATQIAYLYDGWNVIAEYDLTAANPSASPTKRHDWGLDLSGSIQGAGGVGGLIRTKISSTSYFPTYDGNGNICELVNASNGTFGARYHYDPFGNTIYESGSAAISNLYRFSSKPVDRESGFYYYGYRYYDTVRGRWLNRDPIGEQGGINLYRMVGNNPLNLVDVLGLALTSTPGGLSPSTPPSTAGNEYPTADQAAQAAGDAAIDQTLADDYERGGLVCECVRGGRKVYITTWTLGDTRGTPIGDPGLPTTPIPPSRKYNPVGCPECCVAVGSWHTHGDGDGGNEGDLFSDTDLDYANDYKEPSHTSYMRGPEGHHIYEPSIPATPIEL
jgi:RHS repeat-associated protein